jgi:hyaluronoglucosaminidase
MNREVYRNVYDLNSYIQFSGKVKLYVSSRNIHFEMYSKLPSLIDKDKFDFVKAIDNSLTLSITYDSTIKADGYLLDIKTGLIHISASNNRGLIYGIDALNSLCIENEYGFMIPIILIEDEPSFINRGIIEGFYGKPWTLEERKDMISFMRKNRLNSYIYAPKTDEYHRAKWCDLYPEETLNEINTIFKLASLNQIDFFYTISPGYIKEGDYAFDYLNDDDFKRLYHKIDQLIELGITNFGLLLDDIDYKLNEKQEIQFKRPGVAHAYICNQLNRYLDSKVKKYKMVMCPTEYHQIGQSRYREDLKQNLDYFIGVFFTGDNVCAEAITKSDMELTKEAIGKDIYIWDNFPVSDFTYGVREYLAPIRNRYKKISDYASSYYINPSLNYYISKIGMQTMAEYAWNSEAYNSEKAFERALKENNLDQAIPFVDFLYPSVLSYGKLHEYNNLVKEKQYNLISKIYQDLYSSVKELSKQENPLIEELKPWLNHAIKETEIVEKIISDEFTKEDVLEYLEDKHFLGMEVIDNLIKDKQILTTEEYQELITKRRGPQWYRVFEEKRWKK